MPHTVTTPTLVLCNDLATYINGQSSPSAPDSVKRAYLATFDLKKVTGRQVRIFPVAYTNGPADRGHDNYQHTVRVVVLRNTRTRSTPKLLFRKSGSMSRLTG